MRVPALNWDDFGASSNKAVTQHDQAWDHFKGGFDVLGTKIGVLFATMVDPLEPTLQIQSKYTHEIQILRKGEYKYDRVEWKQDFRGWKTRVKKTFIEHNTFDPWPDEVYKRYDEVRMSLADIVFQKIEDAISIGQVGWVLKICKRKQSLIRLKARGLVVPIHQGKGYYKYDMTPLGHDVLVAYEKNEKSQVSQISI